MKKDPETAKPWYKIAGCLLAVRLSLLPVVLVGVALIGNWYEGKRPTHYENGSEFSIDVLPESASDIRYIPSVAFSPWGRTYEFSCSEEDFRSWVETKRQEHPELSEIRALENSYYPAVSPDGSAEMVNMQTVLVSDWRHEDQGLHYVYDLNRQRALRWSHSR